MRALWLASAAFIVATGMAFAQTTPPAGTSPGMSNPGMQPPGTSPGMSNPGMSNPGMAPGMSNPGASQGMSNQGTMSPMQPPSATGRDEAAAYLQRASTAIQQHRRVQADNYLSHAETLMLTRSVPQSNATTPDSSPRITAIQNARAALRRGNWSDAEQDTNMAMHHNAMMNNNAGGTSVQ
jgi:hypothetical protein